MSEHVMIHFLQVMLHTPAEQNGDPDARQAAVLIVIRMRPWEDDVNKAWSEEPHILLIKRAEFESDPWSGHLALPGGRAEPGDANLQATAIRETREETGVDVAVREIFGQLDDVTPRTPQLPPIVIRPFVALLQRAPELALSHEVASAFWVPLSAIRDPASWKLTEVEVRGAKRMEPAFVYESHVVWGLTQRVLHQFLSLTS